MASRDPAAPNILFILTDDQGPWALGCAGNSEIRTPTLDALAARGLRFENFFCTSPVCSPSRASLLTGRIPSQHGVHDWIRAGNHRGEYACADPVEYLRGQTAYTDLLAEAGYVCGMSGKWHLGNGNQPQKSFAHWFVHARGGGPYNDAPMIVDGEVTDVPGYVTDVITDDALAFLDERAGDDRPFYLSVHYTAPHSPWIDEHPEEIVASYEDCPFASCPQEPPHPWARADYADTDAREKLKGYFAAVTAMDASVGRLLERLDARGLRESTLVVFTSDNGFNCGHHGLWGKGNGTFPLNMYDTSVKVPLIVSHPGRIVEGEIAEALASGYDVMPTLLDYAGVANPEGDRLPGRSFAPLLRGEEGAPRGDVVVFDEYGPVRMIRDERWKYVHRYPYGPHELYDLAADPGERTNLADSDAAEATEARAELRARLEEWFNRYVDPAIDGARHRVYGRGQLRMVGRVGGGHEAFHGPHSPTDGRLPFHEAERQQRGESDPRL